MLINSVKDINRWVYYINFKNFHKPSLFWFIFFYKIVKIKFIFA